MNVHLPPRMTVDEFLHWSGRQERGRYELEGGRVVVMPAENIGHTETKARVYLALLAAISRSGLPVYAMPDGPTVRIDAERAYEPDALIAPLPRPDATSLEVANPVAVFEVLSPTPSSIRRDLTIKVAGYALVASIQHYVVVDPDERVVFRFRREGTRLVAADEVRDGTLRLDPPGLDIPIDEMLARD